MSFNDNDIVNLYNSLKSKKSEGVRQSLTTLLKTNPLIGGTPPATGAVGGAPGETCELGGHKFVEGTTCAAIITDCLAGKKCAVEQFEELRDLIDSGKVVVSEEKDRKIIADLLKQLKINPGSTQSVRLWLAALPDTEEGKKIKSNSSLLRLLYTFSKIINPVLESPEELCKDTYAETLQLRPSKVVQRDCDYDLTRIPMRGEFKQAGGGAVNNSDFLRYIDNINNIASMRGGGDYEAINVFSHIENLYGGFVNSLKDMSKQVAEEDDKKIRDLLAQLKNSEEKLNQVAGYLGNFDKIKNDPRISELMNQDKVTAEMLEQLKEKYNKYKKQVGGQVSDLTQIVEFLNKYFKSIGLTGELQIKK